MSRYVTVAQSDAIQDGSSKCVVIDNKEIALFRVGGEFYAIDNECPHYGAQLCYGMTHEKVVACPWHWWQFDITSGKCLTVPGMDIKSYKVRLEDGEVQIEIEEAAPPAAPASS